MKLLKELLEKTDYEIINGTADVEICDIIMDSRKAVKGCAFFCFVGTNFDAHDFLDQIKQKEPAAIVVEKDIDIDGSFSGITVIKVKNTRYAMGMASAEFFSHPAEKLITIGITGTKGKTSLAYIIQKILNNAGIKCGNIGTMGVDTGTDIVKTGITTPEAYDVQKYMSLMVQNGCRACVMEVSSQALKLDRVSGITYDYGIFTNLSIDHIGAGEHKDFDDYVHCKSLLFRQCKNGLFNKDDAQYIKVTEDCTCKCFTYAYDNDADIRAYDFEYVRNGEYLGVKFKTKGLVNETFSVSAPGEFSMFNALPAIELAHILDISMDIIKQSLMQIHVKGRMEPVKISSGFSLFIDYAHNAISMESILKAMRQYRPNRLISLFGCGGNRSKTRRYEMGEASGRYADLSIITEDNSRLEDIGSIVEDILTGIKKTDGKYIVIPDRKEAIRYAIEHAEDGDIVLLLGKGHEDYMDKGGKKIHFDERDVIRDILR